MDTQPSKWAVGYAAAAAALLIIAGTFHFIAGLVGLIDDEFYVVGQKWVFEFDITTWGWIHLILGVVLVGSGLLILTGNLLGRIVGVVVAGVSAVGNFMWMPYYPIWSTVLIAFAVAIIWALTVHGRDINPTPH